MTTLGVKVQRQGSNYQGIRSLNNCVIGKVKRKVRFNDDLAVFPSSCFSGRINDFSVARNVSDFMNFPLPWENDRASRYNRLNAGKGEQQADDRQRSFSSDDVPSDTESLHSVQSSLEGITLRCQSADGVRPTKRPSRRVICKFVEKTPKADDKNRKKSPIGTIISQAVFPDENNPGVATPVLRLKKGKRCSKCQRYTTLCPCKLDELARYSEKNDAAFEQKPISVSKKTTNLNISHLKPLHDDPGKPPSSQQKPPSKILTSTTSIKLRPRTPDRMFVSDMRPPTPPLRTHSNVPSKKVALAKENQAKRVIFANQVQRHEAEKKTKPPVPSRQFQPESSPKTSNSLLVSGKNAFQKTGFTNFPFERIVPIKKGDSALLQRESLHRNTNATRGFFPNQPVWKTHKNLVESQPNLTTASSSTGFKKFVSAAPEVQLHKESCGIIRPTTRNIMIQRGKPPTSQHKRFFQQKNTTVRSANDRVITGQLQKSQQSYQKPNATESHAAQFGSPANCANMAPKKSISDKLHPSSFSSRVFLSLRPFEESSKQNQKSRVLFTAVETAPPWKKWQSRNTNFSNNCDEELNQKAEKKLNAEKISNEMVLPQQPSNGFNLPQSKYFEDSTASTPPTTYFSAPNPHQNNRCFKGLLMFETTSTRRKKCSRTDASNEKEMSSEVNGSIITPEENQCNEGVEEGPMLKVKEIRNKYKVRDYENYAKPKSLTGGKNNQTDTKIPSSKENRLELIEDDLDGSNHEVAQQVMSLFKGALTVEKELEALELEKQMQEEETQRVTEQTSPSEKSSKIIPLTNEQVIASKNPLKNTPSTTRDTAQTRTESEEKPDQDSTLDSSRTEEDNKPAESFDESLDQFYDVLSGLTS